MTMKTNTSRVPELLLEQLALGEIDPADERWLRGQLDAQEIERRLTALRAADAAFEARHDTADMIQTLQDRVRIAKAQADGRSRARASARFVLPSLAALACALLWIALPSGSERAAHSVRPPETILIKGLAPHLVLYRRVGERTDTLLDGAHAAPGNMLQIGYVAAEARYGVIVSLDGAGAVTLHFPDAETASTQLEGKGEQLLLHAYELDAAPSFEHFVFVTADRPIDVRSVLEAARNLARTKAQAQRGALRLAPGLAQYTLTLVKE